MIEKPTVFILGAGASAPYGYPSGQKLVDDIKESLIKKSLLYRMCLLFDFSETYIRDFAEALHNSLDSSIDAFLERRPVFIDLGKIIITFILVQYEITSHLLSPGADKWYRELINNLKSSTIETFDNNVSFLTFNYDRSFEHCLFHVIQNSYEEISDKKCADIVNKIPIIHLHGEISKLPWQVDDGTGRPYNNNFSALNLLRKSLDNDEITYKSQFAEATHYIRNISRQIKIIHENDIDKDERFKKAHSLLEQANNIYFLGFGYHDDNLKRLKIAELSNAVKRNNIDGTTHALGRAKINRIKSVTEGKLNLSNNDYKILQFFKDKVDFA